MGIYGGLMGLNGIFHGIYLINIEYTEYTLW